MRHGGCVWKLRSKHEGRDGLPRQCMHACDQKPPQSKRDVANKCRGEGIVGLGPYTYSYRGVHRYYDIGLNGAGT